MVDDLLGRPYKCDRPLLAQVNVLNSASKKSVIPYLKGSSQQWLAWFCQAGRYSRYASFESHFRFSVALVFGQP